MLFQKSKTFFTMLFTFITICSCNESEQHDEGHYLVIKEEAPLVTTGMNKFSLIAIPDSIYSKIEIINSEEELNTNIPISFTKDIPLYEKLNFSESSIVNIKFRCFYAPEKITYKILEKQNKITIQQLIYTSGDINYEGYFIMSSLLIDKIQKKDDIILSQSFMFH